MDSILWKSASDLAASIRRKDISPVELMDLVVGAIELRNPSLNAIIFHDFDDARSRAVEAESAIALGRDVGPLHGIPTLIKDLFDFKPGWPATFGGIPSLQDFRTNDFCPFAERVEAAGAMIVGKTNSPVMGFRGVCDNPLFGATRNPFDVARNSGGSSGGSAAAVADGIVPFAEGTDGGGSIRIPSAWCGTFGFQPSFGRVPFVVRPNALGNTMPFLYEGPITRTVQDAVLVLNSLSGRDARDPFSYDSSPLELAGNGFEGLRVGYTRDYGTFPIDSNIAEAFDDTIGQLRKQGVSLAEIRTPLPYSQQELSDLWCRQIMLSNVATIETFLSSGVDLLDDNAGVLPDVYVDWVETVRRKSVADILSDYNMRTEIIDYFNRIFNEVDILLTPTVAANPVLNSPTKGMTFGPSEINGVGVDPSIGWCMTYFTNFTGHAAASVPLGLHDGLPVGMQVMGGRYGDEDVMRFAAAFERFMPWDDMYRVPADRDL